MCVPWGVLLRQRKKLRVSPENGIKGIELVCFAGLKRQICGDCEDGLLWPEFLTVFLCVTNNEILFLFLN